MSRADNIDPVFQTTMSSFHAVYLAGQFRPRPRLSSNQQHRPVRAWNTCYHATGARTEKVSILSVVAQQCPVLHHTTLPRLPVPSVRPARHSRRPRRVGPPTKLGSSVVECRTHNQESLCSNPPLLPCRRLGIFVLSIDAPVHSAV